MWVNANIEKTNLWFRVWYIALYRTGKWLSGLGILEEEEIEDED